MHIALDAMGSDDFPKPDVEGAVLAAREYGDDISLIGDETLINAELKKYNTAGLKLTVVHASQSVSMTDKPATVGKEKPESSMAVGMRLVKAGQADAFVTAGNTGAALAIATLYTLKRIEGVKRPALSAIVPSIGNGVTLLDVGANADSKADWLLQFAIMGRIFSKNALGIQSPRVGLLSNGEEEGKGNELIREAAELLKNANLNFVGNVEPKDIFKNQVDVLVADGFVGNILIKSLEAATSMLTSQIRKELMTGIRSKVGGLLSRPAFDRVRKKIDPFEIGGAPLLGVDGVVIIGHGRSNANAIKNAIRQARQAVSGNLIDAIRQGISQ